MVGWESSWLLVEPGTAEHIVSQSPASVVSKEYNFLAKVIKDQFGYFRLYDMRGYDLKERVDRHYSRKNGNHGDERYV